MSNLPAIVMIFSVGGVVSGVPMRYVAMAFALTMFLVHIFEIPLLDGHTGGSCDPKTEGQNNSMIHYGVCQTQGRRSHMEDYYVVKPDCYLVSAGKPLENTAFVGVYDGHGGKAAGVHLSKMLHQTVRTLVDFNVPQLDTPIGLKNMEDQMRKAFLKTDLEFLEVALKKRMRDGSTATTAVLLGDVLVCANVGDSRTIMSHRGRAVALSVDHKPDLPAERYRIEAAGGHVRWGSGCYRVEGDLAVSRAFGDKDLKRWVLAEPDITKRKLKPGDESLILASDGLWDVMGNQEVVDLVQRHKDAKAAAEGLVVEAYNRGSGDNITVLVLDLAAWMTSRASATGKRTLRMHSA